MLEEVLLSLLQVPARSAAKWRHSSSRCARSVCQRARLAVSLSRRRSSLKLQAWRQMSGWEEQLEMLEPDARAGPPVDKEALSALKRDFDIADHVMIHEGIPGMLRVMMRHGSESRADVCLRGATVTSWRISNGSEVVYIRPDTALEDKQPISGGISVMFPHGMSESTPADALASPLSTGFASSQDWEVVETGITPQKSEPFVRLRLRDSPESRALWNFPFELDFTVTLGVKQLGLRLSVCNKGSTNMEFCTSLRTHLGVSDLEAEEVKLLGLQGVRYIDHLQQSNSINQRWPSPLVTFTGPNDMLFLESRPRVALEVGTGCSVFVENTAGFEDYGVWNMWHDDNMYYRNFMCLSSSRVGRPVNLAPGHTWEGVTSLFVRDVLLSKAIPPNIEEDKGKGARRKDPPLTPYRG